MPSPLVKVEDGKTIEPIPCLGFIKTVNFNFVLSITSINRLYKQLKGKILINMIFRKIMQVARYC